MAKRDYYEVLGVALTERGVFASIIAHSASFGLRISRGYCFMGEVS